VTITPERAAYTVRVDGDVSGMVAAGEYVYQQQVNVEEGGLVYVLEAGHIPYQKVELPVRLLPRIGPSLIDRHEEMTAITGSVRPGASIFVTGPDGIGKSLLLSHSAHEDPPPELDAGVVHIRAGHESFEDLVLRLFYAFHDSLLPTPFVPPPSQIQRELSSIKASVIVDELELDRGETAALLDMAAQSAFVVASRDLALENGIEVNLAGLSVEDAIELFNRELGGAAIHRDELADLCHSLGGHPQCIVLAARLVGRLEISPGQLVGELGPTDPCLALAERCLDDLPERQKEVARFLAALGGGAASDYIISSAINAPSGEPVANLHSRGIAVSASPTHRLNPILQKAAEGIWDLDVVRDKATDLIKGWLATDKSGDHSSPDHDAWLELGIRMIESADESRNSESVLSLGLALEPRLATSGRWGAWQSVLESVQRAALELADGQAVYALTLHQLGSKALCYGQTSRAEVLLNDALRIRKRIGLESAAEATQHNLDVLKLPPPPPGGAIKSEQPGPKPSSFPKTVATMAIGAAVVLGSWLGLSALVAGEGQLVVDPAELTITDVVAGSDVAHQIFLANAGDAPLEIEALEIDGDAAFRAGGACGPRTRLDPDESCEVQITFEPEEPGEYSADLVVASTGEVSTISVPILAKSVAPAQLVVSSGIIDFGVVEAGLAAEQPLELSNSGDVDLILEPLHLELGESFAIVDTECGSLLQPGASCFAAVRFAPGREGGYSDTLIAESTGTNRTTLVELVGIGVGEAELVISPSTLDLGEFRVDETHSIEAVIQNEGTADAALDLQLVRADRFVLADHSCQESLEPGQGCVVRIEFLPMEIDQALMEFEVVETGLAEIRYVAPEKRYSGILTVRSDRGQNVEAAITGLAVLPLPDLVVRIDRIEAIGFDENDFPFYRITATVMNLGRVVSSSGALGLIASIDDGDDVGADTGFLIPLLGNDGEPIVVDDVDPGVPTAVEGTLVVPVPNLTTGTLIRLSAVVDACITEELSVPVCGIPELNEDNNNSKTVESTVPFRFLITFPFPVFPFEDLFVVPFPTTTTLTEFE